VNCSDDNEETAEVQTLNERVFADSAAETDQTEHLIDDLQSLSEPERVWLQWFYSLSEEDQRIVELCGEKGVSVNASNFEQMKAIVRSYGE
jgi:hypothetical protein